MVLTKEDAKGEQCQFLRKEYHNHATDDAKHTEGWLPPTAPESNKLF